MDCDHHGYTPIHFLAMKSQHCLETLKLFVRTAILIDRSALPWQQRPLNSEFPLLLATTRRCDEDVIKTLVEASHRGARWLAPFTGGETKSQSNVRARAIVENVFKSPLGACWEDYELSEEDHKFSGEREFCRDGFRRTAMDMLTAKGFELVRADDEYSYKPMMWRKSMLLLKPHLDDPNILMKHLVCLQWPVPELLALASQVYPEQVSEPDSDGRIPLHHVLNRDGSPCRSWKAMCRTLLNAYPESVRLVDPLTNLIPVCLVAKMQVDDGLDVIYDMLLSDPTALEVQRNK
mgnify:CR=1 FL=1